MPGKFKHIVFSALPAGIVAALLLSMLQIFWVTPLILQAETYEVAAEAVHHEHAIDPGLDELAWQPEDGWQRTLSTAGSNIVMAIGFALMLTGLEFGLIIGIITGFISFIPFVGAIFGFIASVGVALVQFWPDPVMIGIVIAIFIVGQIVEGYILIPSMVGGKIGLHPVWVMFALLAGGTLFGFVGVLIAVPMAAVVGVLSRFAVDQYLQSPIYSGAPPEEPEEPIEK